jgi:hypothetical protein
LGHRQGGKVRRLAAFGDRLDDPGREKRQPHHAPHVTGRKMFSPGDLGDRSRPTRQQIVGPSIRTGGRVEQRQIDAGRLSVSNSNSRGGRGLK